MPDCNQETAGSVCVHFLFGDEKRAHLKLYLKTVTGHDSIRNMQLITGYEFISPRHSQTNVGEPVGSLFYVLCPEMETQRS